MSKKVKRVFQDVGRKKTSGLTMEVQIVWRSLCVYVCEISHARNRCTHSSVNRS